MQPAIIFIRFNVILTTNRLISKTSQQIPTDIFQSRLWKSLSILFLSNQQSPTRFVYCCLIQIKVAHPHIWEAGASKYLTFLLKKWLICVPQRPRVWLQNYVKLIDALNIFLKYVYSKFPPGKDVILLCFFWKSRANFAPSPHSSMTHWLPSQPSKSTTEMGTDCFACLQRSYSVFHEVHTCLIFLHGGQSWSADGIYVFSLSWLSYMMFDVTDTVYFSSPPGWTCR